MLRRVGQRVVRPTVARWHGAPLPAVRQFSANANAEHAEHAEQHEEAAGSQEKQLGNPIAWLNPLSGPDAAAAPDTGPLRVIKWWWFAGGVSTIMFMALLSRRRNIKKEEAEENSKIGGFA